MKKYKIGEISRMLNMPVQTIRFYEQHGIVQPKKDEETGYRYYDSWDLNNLIDCLHIRGLDFSLSETERMINSEDLDEITKKYMQQENVLLHKIEDYKMRLDVLSRERLQIQNLTANSGKMLERRSPALIYHRFRNNDIIESRSGISLAEGIMNEMHAWVDLVPDVTPTFMLQYESYLEPEGNRPDFWWGWSLPAERALRIGIDARNPNEYLAPMDCVYMIFSAEVRGGFVRTFHKKVLSEILAAGYHLNGNPIGRLITRTHEKGVHIVHLETWVPVI